MLEKEEQRELQKGLREPEHIAKVSKQARYVLRLYIAGLSSKSSRAIENIRKICDEQLKDRCDLEVVDVYQHPLLAAGEQIIAIPTLIKKLPPPLRKFIGDLHDTEKILIGLDLESKN